MPPVTGFTGGDSLDVLKPDPRMLHHAADQLAPGPADASSATAMSTPPRRRAAGVPFLLHTAGYRQAPVEALPHAAAFADFAELPGLIAGLLGARAIA